MVSENITYSLVLLNLCSVTRQPHDQFAKQYLKELLEPLGTVEISREIPGETLQIDLIFAPSPEPPNNPPALGLLAQLASKPCLLDRVRFGSHLPPLP